jgi:synaptobrevin family protein YKT6
MKIISVGLYRIINDSNGDDIVTISEKQGLSSFNFFQKSSISEMCQFISKLLTKQIYNNRNIDTESVTYNNFMCHCHIPIGSNVSAVIITDGEYPKRIIYQLLFKLTSDENISDIDLGDIIHKYQDPKKIDSLMRVKDDLRETKEILVKSIDAVLGRGEQLDVLVEKSAELSRQSKLFYKQARRTNSCCTIS